jgi:hypothetical protein
MNRRSVVPSKSEGSDQYVFERARTIRRALLFAVASVALCSDAIVLAQPGTVYAYNRRTSRFDNNGEGFIWQSMGLLEPNGRPGTVQAGTNNIVNSGGQQMGSVIRDNGGNIIGYSNLNGDTEAYNLSGGATGNQAWRRVGNGGTFNWLKHGAKRLPQQGAGGAEVFGGGIMGDSGLIYDGFARAGGGAGTGCGYTNGQGDPTGPCRLTPRPGANITFNANGCFTSIDPDGAGPETSVQASAQAIPGVAAATGQPGVMNNTVQVTLGGTAQQQAAGWRALRDRARAQGFLDNQGQPSVGDWIASLPFPDQWATANAVIANTGATPNLQYGSGPGGPPQAGGCEAVPVQATPDSGPYIYGYDEPFDGLGAWLYLEPGDLARTSIFHLRQLGESLGLPPPEHWLASGIVDFRFQDIDPALASSVDVALQFYLENPSDAVTPYWFDGGAWQAITDFAVDDYPVPSVRFQTTHLGPLAVFAIPEPASLSLLLIGAAALAVRRGRQPT